ncbi:MAG: hypothetical protein C0475_05125 [Planctomyces sp.]|nr:hypothetical protein [Planctomyces sp.]MBA4038812.1 hypothetical protein [Planctomyces sp.]MBA4119783.1 hypothetical protein [Isosphaera sp.]
MSHHDANPTPSVPWPVFPVPRLITMGAGVLGFFVALSAAVVIVVALVASPREWWMVLSEPVVLVAGLVAVWLALGRFREAPGLTLACVAGGVALGSAMGFQGSGRSVGEVSLVPWLTARMAAALTLGVLGALAVLARAPERSLRPLVVGLASGVGALSMLVGWQQGVVGRGLGGLPPGAQLAAGMGLAVVFGGLLATSVHALVVAFKAAPDRP